MRPFALVAVAVLVAACTGGSGTSSASASIPTPTSASAAANDGLYPDVLDVVARQAADGTWSFDVTLSSPYDSPERYADAWRAVGPDGEELGVRELTHDHAAEQPFTRSLTGIVIPANITEVTIEGRDQLNGWGGTTQTVTLTN